jgi:tetratricopeptide (TPR) repeat protein
MTDHRTLDHLFEANPPALSPDGRYRVQLFDEQTVDGALLRGRARLQYDGDTRELDGCERPQEAIVTASGVVFIVDWLHADGPATQGALLVFDRSGRRIQTHRFGANIASAAAMRDRGVIVVTTQSGEHEDSDTTFTFGLNDGRLISRATTVIEDRTPRTAYDWQTRGFEELADGNTEAARAALLQSVSGALGTMTPFYVAQTERALGELAEQAGDRAAALEHYRNATDANPKIGVKKKIIALERELGR